MKILFLTSSIEEKARGIGVILKALINAAKAEGHEIGLLVGMPNSQAFNKSSTIEAKVEHIQLQHYFREGKDSFHYLIHGGLRKRNLLAAGLRLEVFRPKLIKINPKYLSADAGLEKNLNFVVRSPYFYQFLIRGYPQLLRFVIGRVVRKYKIDMVICASPTVLRSRDVGRAKLVHFVHDVMPLELVETPPDNNAPNRSAREFHSTVTHSDLVLTNSQDTASKVREVNPKANVQVLYGTVSSPSQDILPTAIMEKLGLQPKRFLLFTSVIEKRKNIEKLLEAFAAIAPGLNMPLVLVGDSGYGAKEIQAKYRSLPLEVREKVIFTGYISEADKYTLFKNALVFVFPSIYEGIGLVIIEAMANDLPVITSRRGALPEAGGEAAYYVEDPYNVTEIAQAIMKVASDPSLREQMIRKGREQVDKFSQAKFNQRFQTALATLKR